MSRDDITDDPTVKRELRDLEGIIPENTDRRRFLGTAMATMFGLGAAGCLEGDVTPTATEASGDGGDGGSTPTQDSNGQDLVEANKNSVVWRTAWKAESDYSMSYAASLRGFWADQNIRPVPVARKGFGSPDTARRVGTGKEYIGMGAVDPAIGGLIEGYELKIMGGSKTRNALAMIYRPDRLENALDVEGKTVAMWSAYVENSFQLLLEEAGVSQSDVDMMVGDKATSYAQLAQGEVDAIWGTLGNIPEAENAIQDNDFSLQADPFYNYLPLYGYLNYVNNTFLEENPEYVTRVLEGYSHALGWVILNPRKAVKMMRQDVNQALQTGNIDAQIEVVKVAVIATNLTKEAKENGLCYLSEDALQTTFDGLTEALDLGDQPPSTDDGWTSQPRDNADLRTFSSDEWKQAEETAKRYTQLFDV